MWPRYAAPVGLCWRKIGVRDGKGWSPVHIIDGGIGGVCYSCDVPSVASGHMNIIKCNDEDISIWRESGGLGEEKEWRREVKVEMAHDGDVNCVRWGMGGRMVASGGDDGRVRIWSFQIG